jgi:hypothetical protein
MMGEVAVLQPPALARLLGRYAAVVAGTAAALLALDAVPWLLSGAGRGVTAYRSVEEAERTLGTTILLPAFFPDVYRWPPSSVKASTRPVRAVALTLDSRTGNAGPLLLVQTLDGDFPVPARLLPGGKELHEVGFDLEGTPARMADVLLPPDGTFHDLSLVAKGRHVVFRFQGDPVAVLKMAASLPRRARP